MKRILRIAIFFSFTCAALASFSNLARAQKIDVAAGASTLFASAASDGNSINHQPVSLSGGIYGSVSGDIVFWHHLGVATEFDWRADQLEYGGYQPVRPVLYDLNAVYVRKLRERTYVEFQGGVGGFTTRYYGENGDCTFGSCTNYTDTSHFMGDFGAAVKYYFRGNFFVRPEARIYLIKNNVEFSSNYTSRVGVSIGYTFGGR